MSTVSLRTDFLTIEPATPMPYGIFYGGVAGCFLLPKPVAFITPEHSPNLE